MKIQAQRGSRVCKSPLGAWWQKGKEAMLVNLLLFWKLLEATEEFKQWAFHGLHHSPFQPWCYSPTCQGSFSSTCHKALTHDVSSSKTVLSTYFLLPPSDFRPCHSLRETFPDLPTRQSLINNYPSVQACFAWLRCTSLTYNSRDETLSVNMLHCVPKH